MRRFDPGEFAAATPVTRLPTGFPSPAEDHTEASLDLAELVVKHPAATFFMEASSEAMAGAGIRPRDVLVVDRSLDAVDGCIVVAAVAGNFVVRRYRLVVGGIDLLAEHDAYPPIRLRDVAQGSLWGVVTHVIHTVNLLK